MRANSTVVVVLTGIFIGACASGSTEHVQSSPPGESSFRPGLYSGGNGLSKETAVILETKTPFTGVPSEYAWIRHQYPGSKAMLQSLTPWEGVKRYDIIEIVTKDGEKRALWFEISGMYK